MKKRFCFSLATVLALVGVVLGQSPATQIPQPMPTPGFTESITPGSEQAWTDQAQIVPGESSHFWVSADYLLWWFKKSPLPVPLLTTTTDSSTLPVAGLNEPNTSILVGSQNLSMGARQGARFTAGLWLDPLHQIAVEGSYFFIANQTTVQAVASSGQPGSAILAVPFFNADICSWSTFLLASPGTLAGSALLSLTSRLQGADILASVQTCQSHTFRFNVLFGFRYLDLVENLSYTTASTSISGPNTGLILDTSDQFGMRNQFFGGEVGARAGFQMGQFQATATAKLALGAILQSENLNGFAITNFFSAPAAGRFTDAPAQFVPGSGLFVQPSNLGRFNRYRMTVVPEVNVTVGYQLTNHLGVYCGYDFLYIGKVIRPGNQIGSAINVSQTVQNTIVGNTASPGIVPIVSFLNSDFWAQGIHTGLEFRY